MSIALTFSFLLFWHNSCINKSLVSCVRFYRWFVRIICLCFASFFYWFIQNAECFDWRSIVPHIFICDYVIWLYFDRSNNIPYHVRSNWTIISGNCWCLAKHVWNCVHKTPDFFFAGAIMKWIIFGVLSEIWMHIDLVYSVRLLFYSSSYTEFMEWNVRVPDIQPFFLYFPSIFT